MEAASAEGATAAAAAAAAAAAPAAAPGRATERVGGEEVVWHGQLGLGAGWRLPRLAAASEEAARPGYRALDASEFLDEDEVLAAKVKLLAELWRRGGADTVVYTGAGVSTASGIGDYASKAKGSVAPHRASGAGAGKTSSRLDLKPTATHHALASMEARGLVGHWAQQNHDRLAQKAGFPQAKINEIHGAWGDMKNQVKMMDDTLRPDLLHWLAQWASRASLCVALGTSLCGMNADQVADAVADRFPSSGEGLVIIGLQRTCYDEKASLRIWGLCDDTMRLVARELRCPVPDPKVLARGAQWESKHPRLAYNTPTRSARDPL